jgi:hypothetical protein
MFDCTFPTATHSLVRPQPACCLPACPPLINHGAPFRNRSFIIRLPDMQKARKKNQLVAARLLLLLLLLLLFPSGLRALHLPNTNTPLIKADHFEPCHTWRQADTYTGWLLLSLIGGKMAVNCVFNQRISKYCDNDGNVLKAV